MNSIYLDGNKRLPMVILDKGIEKFEISGISNHSDASEYFEPVIKWIDEYTHNPLKKTIFEFKMDYYDSVSSLMIFKIMQKLQNLKDSGKDVLVKWFYADNDESMIETGYDFKDIFIFDIDLVKLN